MPRKSVKTVDYPKKAYKRRSMRDIVGMPVPMSYAVARPHTVYSTERKYFDVEKNAAALVATAATWAGTEVDPAASCLFSPGQGDAINQRVGNKVLVHKIAIRGLITVPKIANQASGMNPFVVRYILYMDMQTNKAQSQGEDLMENGTAVADTILAYQNLNNFGRFRVLKDKMIAITRFDGSYDGTANQIDYSGQIRPFKIYYKFRKPVPVRFGANNGNVADIVDNSFHLIALSSDIGMNPTIGYKARIVYSDA